MATNKRQKTDHWSSEAYKNAAGFVPKLTTTVFKYLNVHPDDRIVDIGCGDGQLTAQIAAAANAMGFVLGLDASESFIATAKEKFCPDQCSYELQDCTKITSNDSIPIGEWDKVFSNAALHWILRNPDTRINVFRDIHELLKPGGKLVFEMGGKGNVAEIQAAFTAVLVAHGVSIQDARKANPWFFPSTDWMSATLSKVGFEVEICEYEYRPTKLTTDAGGGLEGWVRLMGAQYLEAVPEAKRESVVKGVCETLEDIVTREEDGSKWIGYVRLRAVARKR